MHARAHPSQRRLPVSAFRGLQSADDRSSVFVVAGQHVSRHRTGPRAGGAGQAPPWRLLRTRSVLARRIHARASRATDAVVPALQPSCTCSRANSGGQRRRSSFTGFGKCRWSSVNKLQLSPSARTPMANWWCGGAAFPLPCDAGLRQRRSCGSASLDWFTSSSTLPTSSCRHNGAVRGTPTGHSRGRLQWAH